MPRKHLYIDAIRDKQRGQSTNNFTVNFSGYLDLNDVQSLLVLSASVDNTAYSFRGDNNKLYYIVDDTLASIGLPVDIFIENVTDQDANPNNDLVNIINGLFTANGHNIVCSFDSATGKLTFTNNTGLAVRFIASDEYEQSPLTGSKANIKLGLVQQALLTTTLANGQSITGAGVVRLQNSSYYITCDVVENNTTYLGNSTIGEKATGIICNIPTSSNFGEVCTFQNIDFEDTVLLRRGGLNTSITFTVRDELMELIPLNNGNVRLHLLALY